MKCFMAFTGTLLLFAAGVASHKNYDVSEKFENTEVIVSVENNGKILTLKIIKKQPVVLLQLFVSVNNTKLFLQKMHLQQRKKAIVNLKQDKTTSLFVLKKLFIYRQHEKNRKEKGIETENKNAKLLDNLNAQITIIQK